MNRALKKKKRTTLLHTNDYSIDDINRIVVGSIIEFDEFVSNMHIYSHHIAKTPSSLWHKIIHRMPTFMPRAQIAYNKIISAKYQISNVLRNLYFLIWAFQTSPANIDNRLLADTLEYISSDISPVIKQISSLIGTANIGVPNLRSIFTILKQLDKLCIANLKKIKHMKTF